ncbi:MAG: hypothetical protein ACJ8C4_15970 [Gemmataceae bacterium]
MPDPILIGKAFAIALAMGLAIAFVFGRSPRNAIASTGAVLALMMAVFAGTWVLGLWPHFPPRDVLDRMLVIVLPVAAVAELIARAAPRPGWVLRCAVAALAAPILLYGSVYVTDLSGPGSREWPPAKTWLIYAVLAILLLSAWTAMNRLAVRTQERMPLWCVAGALMAASAVIMLSGYATGGQLAVPVAGGLAGVALASLAGKDSSQPNGAMGVAVVALFALLVIGRLFAGLSDWNAGLLFVAPLMAWVPELLPVRVRRRAMLRLLLAAAPAIVALILAQQKFAADSGEGASDSSVNDYLNLGK